MLLIKDQRLLQSSMPDACSGCRLCILLRFQSLHLHLLDLGLPTLHVLTWIESLQPLHINVVAATCASEHLLHIPHHGLLLSEELGQLDHTILYLCFHPEVSLLVLDRVFTALTKLVAPLVLLLLSRGFPRTDVNLRLGLLGLSAPVTPTTTESGHLEVAWPLAMMRCQVFLVRLHLRQLFELSLLDHCKALLVLEQLILILPDQLLGLCNRCFCLFGD